MDTKTKNCYYQWNLNIYKFCDKLIIIMGVSNGTGTAYLCATHDFVPGFSRVRIVHVFLCHVLTFVLWCPLWIYIYPQLLYRRFMLNLCYLYLFTYTDVQQHDLHARICSWFLSVTQAPLDPSGALEFISRFCGVRVARSLVFSIVFLSTIVCPISFGNCICPSIYSFCLPLWYLHTFPNKFCA